MREAMRGRRPALTLLCAFGLGLGPGCATFLSGSEQRVELRVDPPDTRVLVDGALRRVGTGSIEVRRDVRRIRFEREGYEPREFSFVERMNADVWWNLVLVGGFWIGFLVDMATGAIDELSPSELAVALRPIDAAAPPAGVTAVPAATTAPAPAEVRTESAGAGSPTGSVDPAATTIPPAPPDSAAADPFAAPGSEVTPPAFDGVIAVMDLVGRGSVPLDPALGAALTDQLRVRLAARHVRVVDRGAQEAALREVVDAEKARSYAACVDAACEIPLGKALSASHILRTGLARFGETCAVSAELVDLTREVSVAAASHKGPCAEESLLVAVEAVADGILIGRR
jgi:hypothetical protein